MTTNYAINGNDLMIDGEIVVNGVEEWLVTLVSDYNTLATCNENLAAEQQTHHNIIDDCGARVLELEDNKRECSDLDYTIYGLKAKYQAAKLLLKDTL